MLGSSAPAARPNKINILFVPKPSTLLMVWVAEGRVVAFGASRRPDACFLPLLYFTLKLDFNLSELYRVAVFTILLHLYAVA